jgi:hypothetical protein
MLFALGVTFPIAYKRPLETLVESVKQLITLYQDELLNFGLSDFLT